MSSIDPGTWPPGAERGSKDAASPDLVPLRILHQFAYCPRLGYMEWVQGEFEENLLTEEGEYAHRRVDKEDGSLRPGPGPGEAPSVARSVMLSAPLAGLIGKVDLIEVEGTRAVPVDYKRGKKPNLSEGAYEPHRVQLCGQGILLRENGFECDHGVIYFAGSRDRVVIPFDDVLVQRTLELAAQLRATAEAGRIPPPLDDSPKCIGCSLVGICLPDEVDFLHHDPGEGPEEVPRKILPTSVESLPVYVQTQGTRIGKSYGVLWVAAPAGPKVDLPIHGVSNLSLFGGVEISTPAIRSLCSRGIPVCFFSSGGWFYGLAHGLGHKNVELRIAQYRAAADPSTVLRISRRLVADKIGNCRTMLRRNAEGVAEETLRELKRLASGAEDAESVETLLGIEGNAGRIYFQNFEKMLRPPAGSDPEAFAWERRNRRPPLDPTNALLSFAYSILTKTWTVTTQAVGFDPYLGFYHRPRYGRPALALDMMEPFRPLIADSTVITVVNGGMVKGDDFVRSMGAVALTESARSAFLSAFERRLSQEIAHPVFEYKISYRQVFEVQARLLGRFLTGEIDDVPHFVTR